MNSSNFDDMLDPALLDPDLLMQYMEDRWREEQESKPINLNTTLSAALNKSPAPWVDGICFAVGLSPKGQRKQKVARIVKRLLDPEGLRAVVSLLPAASRQALRHVLQAGGWAKYSTLTREFGDEGGDSWWWGDEMPTSVLGQARVRGLLFVGKVGIGGRNYKVAVIPQDVREPLSALLADEGSLLAATSGQPEFLDGLLALVDSYYQENEQQSWQPPFSRDQVKIFLRNLAAAGTDPGELVTTWSELTGFTHYLGVHSVEIKSLSDLKDFHLSEWVNYFVDANASGRIGLIEKRHKLRVVGQFYQHLAAAGQLAPEVAARVHAAVARITAPRRKLNVIPRPRPLGGEPAAVGTHPRHGRVVLTYNDLWLIIVCAVEFRGDWRKLRSAAARVPDGPAKQRYVDRLMRYDTEMLQTLLDSIVPLQRMFYEMGREWFYYAPLSEKSAW